MPWLEWFEDSKISRFLKERYLLYREEKFLRDQFWVRIELSVLRLDAQVHQKVDVRKFCTLGRERAGEVEQLFGILCLMPLCTPASLKKLLVASGSQPERLGKTFGNLLWLRPSGEEAMEDFEELMSVILDTPTEEDHDQLLMHFPWLYAYTSPREVQGRLGQLMCERYYSHEEVRSRKLPSFSMFLWRYLLALRGRDCWSKRKPWEPAIFGDQKISFYRLCCYLESWSLGSHPWSEIRPMLDEIQGHLPPVPNGLPNDRAWMLDSSLLFRPAPAILQKLCLNLEGRDPHSWAPKLKRFLGALEQNCFRSGLEEQAVLDREALAITLATFCVHIERVWSFVSRSSFRLHPPKGTPEEKEHVRREKVERGRLTLLLLLQHLYRPLRDLGEMGRRTLRMVVEHDSRINGSDTLLALMAPALTITYQVTQDEDGGNMLVSTGCLLAEEVDPPSMKRLIYSLDSGDWEKQLGKGGTLAAPFIIFQPYHLHARAIYFGLTTLLSEGLVRPRDATRTTKERERRGCRFLQLVARLPEDLMVHLGDVAYSLSQGRLLDLLRQHDHRQPLWVVQRELTMVIHRNLFFC